MRWQATLSLLTVMLASDGWVITERGATASVAADSARPVLLLFTASWCGPCRQMKPELSALKANGWQVIDSAKFTTPLESSVPIVLVDSDANPLLVWQHRVESLPCAVMLRGDREVARGSGYMDRWKLGELARTK